MYIINIDNILKTQHKANLLRFLSFRFSEITTPELINPS